MNKSQLRRRLIESLPALRRESALWKKAENRRLAFVSDYSVRNLRSLTLKDYVIGLGPQNRSFCYRLELDTDDLGNIRGATAFKFGIYFGKTKSDGAKKYRFTAIWGANKEEAFRNIRTALVQLLESARKKRFDEIDENKLSPMFKGKLLHLFHPTEYAPVYSDAHLKHFLGALNVSGEFDTCAKMQRALMDFRKELPQLAKLPPMAFTQFLYREFGVPTYDEGKLRTYPSLVLLDDAINGTVELDDLPPTKQETKSGSGESGKTDYEIASRQRKTIGDRGERLVLEWERKRLQAGGRPDLVRRIEHVAEKNDGAGYDIHSYELDGTPRLIEVKATARPDLSGGFYITANELEVCRKEKAKYHVYLVFSATGNAPKIFVLKHPVLDQRRFELAALAFKVTLRKKLGKLSQN